MRKKSKLRHVEEGEISITFQTDDTDFNDYDPAVNVIPFGKDTTKSNGQGRGPQAGSGILYVYTVMEDGERTPVATFGMTSRPVGGHGQANSSQGERQKVTTYILDNGKPQKANTEMVSKKEMAGGEVSTQGLWSCSACTTLVGSVCAFGMKVLGQYACVGACVAAFSANFVAVYGCASICSTMFNAISAVGCGAGGTVICEEMTDRTPDYINFC